MNNKTKIPLTFDFVGFMRGQTEEEKKQPEQNLSSVESKQDSSFSFGENSVIYTTEDRTRQFDHVKNRLKDTPHPDAIVN